jgi:predicted phosphate transport protein (TIGR00153 family)
MSIATIGRLFGKSPFAPLQAHMEKVALCVERVPELFDLLRKKDHAGIAILAKEISKLEHGADLTKNDIRNQLPKSLFMPVDRGSLLEILALQDCLADKAEDIGVLLTFRDLELIPELDALFIPFLQKNMDTYFAVQKIVQELNDLLETSFGGVEAVKVRDMVHNVAHLEHEVDIQQRELLKMLFRQDDLPTPVFNLWLLVTEAVADLSNLSEKLAHRIRMTLEVK